MKNFVKIVLLGLAEDVGSIFCRIKYTDGKLSITGVEGPKCNGDAKGACCQIVMHWSESGQVEKITPAAGWDHDQIRKFFQTWDRWHLNDMRAGCKHQRAERWDQRPIDPSKPLLTYGRHFPGQRSDTWNMLAWVRPDEHPDGLLTKACPTCGYKYGTGWLKEEVPADVLVWLAALPDSPVTPAWV